MWKIISKRQESFAKLKRVFYEREKVLELILKEKELELILKDKEKESELLLQEQKHQTQVQEAYLMKLLSVATWRFAYNCFIIFAFAALCLLISFDCGSVQN